MFGRRTRMTVVLDPSIYVPGDYVALGYAYSPFLRLALWVGVLQSSGGLHNDMAVHDFDMARFLTDSEVTEVYCKGSCKVGIGGYGENKLV